MTQVLHTAGHGGDLAEDLFADAKIFIVDDHEPNVVILERMLRTAGARDTWVFTDSRRVLAAFVELAPDLVFLDLHMPHRDGLELMADLQAARTDDTFLPIVVVTADTTPAARQRVLAQGAADFLTKPFDGVEVILRARNLLAARRLHQHTREQTAVLEAKLEENQAEQRRVVRERSERTALVRQRLEGRGLAVHLQPIVDLESGRVVGAEALARFAPPPLRPPNHWFAAARSVGLGRELELAAVDVALTQLPLLSSDEFLSINISPDTALAPGLHHRLVRVDASRVVLELTEHDHVDDYGKLLPELARLRSRGVRIAADDTGAGYAGLQHLLRLEPDILKLDLDLIRGIDGDPVRRALATSMVRFAADVGADLVAEGIETEAELVTLRGLGVTLGQGYHLGRPVPPPLQVRQSQ